MLLSLLFPPIPGNMLSRLQERTFVNMQDMLPDNMALLWQLDDFKSDKAADILQKWQHKGCGQRY